MKSDKNIFDPKRLAVTALLAAFAAVLGYIDAILPVFGFLPVPGMKLGLANLAVLLALWLLGPVEAAAVSFLRILVVNLLLFPSTTALAFSLAGGTCSFLVMLLLKKLSFHVIPVSVCGSAAHNLAQTALAALMLGTRQLFSYLLLLLPVGALCGALLGLLSALIVPRLRPILKSGKKTEKKKE